jgi:hypothetical protein
MRSYVMKHLAVRLTVSMALIVPALPLVAQGRTRVLNCRGGSGLTLKVDLDPSPRRASDVVMVLGYTPAKPGVGDVHALTPGTCTWNEDGFADVPVEPGHVRFDVARQAQAWSDTGTREMDTTARAAVFYPDPITLPRYLSDPSHYYYFYVDDQTNLGYPYGALFESGSPTRVTIHGPLVLADNTRRDLLCRGGSAGLRFGGGGTVGTNLVKVILTYRVSATVPGPIGAGLSPGSCSWTDRTAMPKEPGTIAFITPANAQLKQAQSGTTVDRSPTAAEHYPDMTTIAEYLKDPTHFWSFSVMSKDPDSAIAHAVWHRDLTNVIATGRTTETSTNVNLPRSVTGGSPFKPGGAGSTSSVTSVLDIRNVVVRTGLEGVSILFDAAPNLKPTVAINLTDPVMRNSVYEFNGTPTQLTVSGTPNGTLWHYTAAIATPLPRDTRYHYIITAPQGADSRLNQKIGEFKTLGQYVTISFSEINLLSDGDKESNGDILVDFSTCPASAVPGYYLSDAQGAPMDWGDGHHKINVQLKSAAGNAPDKFRLLVTLIDDDRTSVDLTTNANPPKLSCSDQSTVDPGKNKSWEWNTAIIDFDLTKMPGAAAGDSFVRRSKPLANGSTVMFEIRGAILVTRQ